MDDEHGTHEDVYFDLVDVDEDGDYEPGDEDEDEFEHELAAEDAMQELEELEREEEEARVEPAPEVHRREGQSIAQLLENIVSLEHLRGNGRTTPGTGLTIEQITRLLASFRSGQVSVSVSSPAGTTGRGSGLQHDTDDEEEEDSPAQRRSRRSRGRPAWWMKPYEDPQPAGLKLLHGGEFGRIAPKQKETSAKYARNIPGLFKERSMGVRKVVREDVCEALVPNSNGTIVAAYPSNVYSGQFSTDSSFYYVCCKDFNLHIYDTTAPRSMVHRGKGTQLPLTQEGANGHRTTMKVMKNIRGMGDGWTVTDSHLSPNNERMIYASMSSTVYMVNTLDMDTQQTPISFAESGPRIQRRGFWGWDDESYCIWSCRFSADGNEVIAGGRNNIFVYDLLANKRTVKIPAHDDDVNSCCWADSGSNVLISASDDTFIKIWDRRSLGSSTRPSGVFIGHTEGITNVSAKGDGRYVISNGKDQALRLWDLRKMKSNADYEEVKDQHYGIQGFDYRYEDDRTQRREAHPKNCSIMTYRGHMVMRTLIRCHFSPAESTGGSYIYSGSTDGRVHIWSLDGRVVQVLDRSKTLPMSFDPSAPDMPDGGRRPETPRGFSDCVRDVSWHSKEPVLLSAAWSGRGHSTVARHEWKGLSKMNGRLEDWVEKQAAEVSSAPRSAAPGTRRSARHIQVLPGAYDDGQSDETDGGDYYE